MRVFDSYRKKLLRINLTEKTWRVEELSEKFIRKYIGGLGFGTAIMCNEVNPKTDAFDPANKIVLTTGPINGTRAPMFAQSCMMSISPLSGSMINSYAGGETALRIKQSGFDGVVVEGKADSQVYVMVDGDKKQVSILNADKLQGKSTDYTEKALKKLYGHDAGVLSIGEAGENRVRFACVISGTRAYGRGGIGAVFGSKNLKALVFRGFSDVKVYDPDGFEKCVNECFSVIKRASELPFSLLMSFSRQGTGAGMPMINAKYALSTKNHSLCQFDGVKQIDGAAFMEKYPTRYVSCFGCIVHCGQVHKHEKGPFAGMVTRGPEYETMYSFGSEIMNDDSDYLAKAHQVCEEYGMDTLSAGSTMAFAMECFERGIITEKETGGIRLEFGNNSEMIKCLEKIGKRQDIGDVLAEGTKRAAEIIGQGSKAFAMNVKGLESAAWMPQRMKGIALTFATANRGACHKRAPVGPEISGAIPMDSIENKPELVRAIQDKVNALFTLICCRFAEFEYPMELFLDLLATATGIRMNEEEMMQLGEKIWNMERLFGLKSGWTTDDDTLPDRCFEPLEDLKIEAKPLTHEDMTIMLQRYYKLRGWDEKGVPKTETLEKLGIEYA